jgi:2-aminoadipate transaminase
VVHSVTMAHAASRELLMIAAGSVADRAGAVIVPAVLSTARYLSDTQMALRPGILDLGLGHPDPALLPLALVERALREVLTRYGAHALNYGWGGGPGPLCDWLRERIGAREGRAPAADQITITAGISQGLDHVLTLQTQPGDGALVESPVYHLAVRILRDHPLRLTGVRSDHDGLEPAACAAAIARLRAEGVRPRVLYCVPTFNNPSGRSWSLDRRRAIVEIAAREGVLILEDDVYRELAYEDVAPPSLWSLAPDGVVARFGSFSKSLAPGLRVGWLTGGATLVQGMIGGGLVDSGGGVAQLAAMITGTLITGGGYDAHLEGLRAAYRARRDALIAAVREHLPKCAVESPAGGFFVWLTLPDALDQAVLLQRALAAGTAFIPGTRFFVDGVGGERNIRLCFALLPPEDLREAIRRLAAVFCR